MVKYYIPDQRNTFYSNFQRLSGDFMGLWDMFNKINVFQNLLGENKNRTRKNGPGDAGWEMC